MAGKVVTVFCLDGSPSMRQPAAFLGSNETNDVKGKGNREFSGTPSGEMSKFQMAKTALSKMVQTKLIQASKNDFVGIIVLGTTATNNPLADGQQYEHISILRDIALPDVSFLKTLEDLTADGNNAGDCLDAFIVALDRIIEFTDGKKMEKRVVLLTDAESPINADGIEAIVDKSKEIGAVLDIIGLDFDDPESSIFYQTKSTRKSHNEQLLCQLSENIDGEVYPITEALRLLSNFRKRPVKQTTLFRGVLDLGDGLIEIPVHLYKRTAEVKLPSAHQIDAVTGSPLTKGKLKAVYQLIDDDIDTELHEDDLIKGYRYGKAIVPVHEIDEAMNRVAEPKSLKIIGFIHLAKVPREYYVSDAMLLLPEPDNPSAARKLSAFVHGLYERESAIIVRYVRIANANPRIGLLIPKIKVHYEGFVFVYLPFAEDIRQISIPVMSAKSNPTPDQLTAMGDFIDAFDLMTAGTDELGCEAFKPSNCINPVYERMYQCINYRALHPESTLPPANSQISKSLDPLPHLRDENRTLCDALIQLFPQTKDGTTKKTTGKIWGASTALGKTEAFGFSEGDKLFDENLSFGDLDRARKTSCVGPISPLEDFKAMITRKDVDLVTKAVTEMKALIEHLIETSFGNQLFEKAVDCLDSLRSGCIQESEVEEFNDFITRLKIKYANDERRKNIWGLIVRRELGLISMSESPDSDVSQHDAAQFLKHAEPKNSSEVAVVQDDVDDLLELM